MLSFSKAIAMLLSDPQENDESAQEVVPNQMRENLLQ